jgi:hypothetical protein
MSATTQPGEEVDHKQEIAQLFQELENERIIKENERIIKENERIAKIIEENIIPYNNMLAHIINKANWNYTNTGMIDSYTNIKKNTWFCVYKYEIINVIINKLSKDFGLEYHFVKRNFVIFYKP